MDLSPNDIRNYEFPNQMRGYDKEEVDNLLEQVAVALEEARQENLKLSMERDSLKTQLAGLKEFEDTIKNAAIDARRNADATITNAKKEAAEIIAKVKQQTEELSNTYNAKKAEIEKQMAELEQVKRSYISKLRTLINSHLDMVDEVATADVKKEIHGESEDGPTEQPEPKPGFESDNGGIEVTESEDMTRKKLETLADRPSNKEDDAEESDTDDEKAEAKEKLAEKAKAPKPIDPELAAALEQYKSQAEKKVEDLNPEDFGPAPPQGTIVETDKRAEDIPPGFIAKVADTDNKAQKPQDAPESENENGENGDDADSGVALDAQDRPTEHNAIDMDQPSAEDKAKAKVSPDELAKALDGVVSKFEEELDKAEKN
ncbi:MAG: DivIVA domain-containing protein [Candidatus Zixiibacteriota bacterium]|nr:MAG: DivIVA domain-containing protein [candidate division Zixibacteria bacterium]